MTVTIDAPAWAAAVRAAAERVAEAAGVAPDLILTDRFIETLDDLAAVPPDDELFSHQVESAAREYLALRTVEALAAERERTTESAATDTVHGRVLEAKGTDTKGQRVFRVKLISTGDSRNGNRYTEAVLRNSVRLYEGAKAYDRHRAAADLQSSTIAGLVGGYRNVEAASDGLYADLHLLPSAVHAAEALDASIEAQAAGLPPLIGLSHDVQARFKPMQAHGGRHVREAVAIDRVNSIDLVADPSAGGVPVRVLAGGSTTEHTEEDGVTVTTEAVLAAMEQIDDARLAAAGFQRAGTRTTEAMEYDRDSFLGRAVVSQAVEAAKLPAAVATELTQQMPERFTEADVTAALNTIQKVLGVTERAGLTPTVTAQVTRESLDKKRDGLEKLLAGDYSAYRSFKQAWADISGYRGGGAFDMEDVNRRILRESFGLGYDSETRATESMDTSTWAQVLGDSVARRVVAEYSEPSLQTWRQIVSATPPIMDFRTQRIGRIGGYGVLPTVNEGAPYQPLTSPGDEEATYDLDKKGGTEDVTLEMIANDDMRRIQQIPRKLGRAAAQTLFRFVWDLLASNATCTYDSTALFHSNHANTDTSSALSQTTLGVGRRKMRDQVAYGDTYEVLGLPPKYLVVPNELEELAFQLCTSPRAVPSTPASASDSPNINQAQGLTPILVPYFTDADDWYLVADPRDVPTIEVGFYNGRETPELFTQADPNVGSVFNADKFTWKIRFIFSGTVLDHRGFYRGQG